ncbi:DNA-binding transcriptional LysR family regulator [Paenibacillus sp. SORGH_AS306]|uniref:LysR family transcriptional regulator n=1 Tax=unclassified Paenibacillus TaxID=185978 RepID=UPI0027870FD1|nr:MULTISPECIES: LysR family transcriptional regulator [unclassified Paenibacillus]MDQ1233387.1 DNA-binding transcriptional LysR family regulator [Paenibacillus sp. SORGH_AS_0306]MDR6110427.1 DNA-binding transcriptional LysR family regulator [Paenibacillus sp. SORGH_AS_0338]
MDLTELIAFQTVMQEGTFARAAEKLNYAQSTITNQIKRLEKELGLTLFYRNWEATLTPAGQRFAEQVDQLIHHWRYVGDIAKQLNEEEIGTLQIGVTETWADRYLPAILYQFRQYRPKITCEITVDNSAFLQECLQQEKISLALCADSESSHDYVFEPLQQESISLIIPANHVLANTQAVTIDELLSHLLIIGQSSCKYRFQVEKAFRTYEQEPLFYTINQLSLIPLYAEQLNGIGIVPSSLSVDDTYTVLPFPSVDHHLQIGILQPRRIKYNSGMQQLFVEEVRKYFKNLRE